MSPKRILFYSHDAYGMGNIRRTLAICERLTERLPNVAILILTGSPVIHALRIPKKVDYIKLPCLVRDKRESFSSRFWDMGLGELMRFRSDLILAAIKSFEPDLVVVDKKPVGIKREFLTALRYLKVFLPKTRIVLGLRDILDAPGNTVRIWKNRGYFDIIRDYYDRVWIYGDRRVFDAVAEYRMPKTVAEKTVFTGYLGKTPPQVDRKQVRAELGLNGGLFSLVMVGGGGDGYPVMKTYIDGVHQHSARHLDSLLVTGPEMPREQQREIELACSNGYPLRFQEFSDEIENALTVADVVVSMGGYNSTCEILSFRKKAVIVPRIQPVREQYLRASRLAELGLVRMVHPDRLTPDALYRAVNDAVAAEELDGRVEAAIDLRGLDRVVELVQRDLER